MYLNSEKINKLSRILLYIPLPMSTPPRQKGVYLVHNLLEPSTIYSLLYQKYVKNSCDSYNDLTLKSHVTRSAFTIFS